MNRKKWIAGLLALCMLILIFPVKAYAEEIETVPMYRLYNPNSGEHFYTGSVEERENLVTAGWNYEGVAWNAPVSSGTPVHRVYNPNSGDHHYTMSQEEVDMLVALGWQYENVAWNSVGTVPQYRLYNPNADCGSHHYTSSEEERGYLVSLGWQYEGIGWYGVLTTEEEHSHSYTAEVTTEATCGAAGIKTYSCACGDSYTEAIPATGEHSWGEWETTQEPTETAEGSAERICSGCGKTETKTLDKKVEDHKHSYSSSVTTSPTCQYEGVRTYECSCGDKYTESIPVTGHNYVASESKNGCNVTTTNTCSMCGDSYTDFSTNHSWVHTDEQGHWDGYLACHCGGWTGTDITSFGAHAKESGSPADHSYYQVSNWIVDGPASDTCSICGETKADTLPGEEDTDTHSHSWGDWMTTMEPSNSSDGEAERICSTCGAKESKKLEYCEHDYNIYFNTATCTSGAKQTYVCKLCGHKYTDVLGESNPDAHFYTVIDFAAASGTCAEDGHSTYSCKYCGITYTQTISGHDWEYHYEQPGHYGERHLQCELCEWVILESEVEAGYLNLAMQDHMINAHDSTDVRWIHYEPDVYSGKSWGILHQWIPDGEVKEYWQCAVCDLISETAPCEHEWDYYNNYESVSEKNMYIEPLTGGVECSCGWYPTYKSSTNDGDLSMDWVDNHARVHYLHSWHSPSASSFNLYTTLSTSSSQCIKCGEIIFRSTDSHTWLPIDSSVYSVWIVPGMDINMDTIVIQEFGEEHNWTLDEHEEFQYTSTSGVKTTWTDIWKCFDCGITTSIVQRDSSHEYYQFEYLSPNKYEVWECSDCGDITFEEPIAYKDEFYRGNTH